MVKVETLKEDGFVRILRCREDNRIWYQMWLTDLEKGCIDRYFVGMGPGWLICLGSFCVSMWDSRYPLIRGAKKLWYSKGSTVPLNLTFINKK